MFSSLIEQKLTIVLLCQFVAGTQPINALAFVFDGVNFGASDFAYSAYSMVSLCSCTNCLPFCVPIVIMKKIKLCILFLISGSGGHS